MALTYMNLVNALLREMNEVELTSSNFDDARGQHARAKDCIRYAVQEINAHHHQWPFNAYEHTEVLTAGTYEYPWPLTFKTVDWNSFEIQSDATIGNEMRTLGVMDRDEWYTRYRDQDEQARVDGTGSDIPDYVFKTHGMGYGLTPNPDEEYTLTFRYYANPTALSSYDDETTIPEAFEYVILLAAAASLYRFFDGIVYDEKVTEKFKRALTDMRTLLINDEISVRSTVVNYGGGTRRDYPYFIRG